MARLLNKSEEVKSGIQVKGLVCDRNTNHLAIVMKVRGFSVLFCFVSFSLSPSHTQLCVGKCRKDRELVCVWCSRLDNFSSYFTAPYYNYIIMAMV